MKKIALISAIALSGLLYNSANAQLRVHIGLNFGVRPVYVPAQVVQQPADYCEPTNYNGDEDYYYLPEVDAYYSVPEGCYYYSDGDRWVSAAYLPGVYRDYDWRTVRRYEVRAPRPYMHHDYYRSRYNGVAFNGNWNNPNYHRGFAYNNHFDRNQNWRDNNQYRRDDRRFDNRNNNYGRHNDQNRGRDDRQFNQNRGRDDRQFNQNHDRYVGGAQQHFAQNMPQRSDRGGDHRPGRF
jgi:hypothetical protein